MPVVRVPAKLFLRRARFRRRYWVLSMRGQCDTPGGAEYRRVYREWIRSGHSIWVTHFIRSHANAPAS